MFKSILVVCIGNICRSPTGERLLKESLPEIKISSAGLGALVGHSADEYAAEIAGQNDISLDGHIAKQLTSKLCREYDLILVMERKHIEAVCNIAPESRGKIMLFGHWIGGQDIPDPYKKSKEAFSFVFKQLNDATREWVRALNR
ncbi:TPA: protein tyrosine phosphatase [Serratia fonticola]